MDIIDQANDMHEFMLERQRSMRKPSSLRPVGQCHYCNEILPKVGQLFCGIECREDHEHEDRLRKQAGRIE